jgi:hypothetical protein
VSFRYTLRLSDGSDAGEYETADQSVQPGDEIRTDGNRRLRVLAVIPVAVISEFVDRPMYGALEVEPL